MITSSKGASVPSSTRRAAPRRAGRKWSRTVLLSAAPGRRTARTIYRCAVRGLVVPGPAGGRTGVGAGMAPDRRGCLLNRDHKRRQPDGARANPPPWRRGPPGSRSDRGCAVPRSAVGDVDGALLGALAADRRVGGRLDVVGGAARCPSPSAGSVSRSCSSWADGALRVLGRPDVRRVVGDLAGEPAVERLALGLLERGRAEVGAGAGVARRAAGRTPGSSASAMVGESSWATSGRPSSSGKMSRAVWPSGCVMGCLLLRGSRPVGRRSATG